MASCSNRRRTASLLPATAEAISTSSRVDNTPAFAAAFTPLPLLVLLVLCLVPSLSADVEEAGAVAPPPIILVRSCQQLRARR